MHWIAPSEKNASHAEGVLYLTPNDRFDQLQALVEGAVRVFQSNHGTPAAVLFLIDKRNPWSTESILKG